MRRSDKKEFSFEIEEEIEVLWESDNGNMDTEVNMVSIGGDDAKLDIRHWMFARNGDKKMGKGIRLTEEEANALADILQARGYGTSNPNSKKKKNSNNKKKKVVEEEEEEVKTVIKKKKHNHKNEDFDGYDD